MTIALQIRGGVVSGAPTLAARELYTTTDQRRILAGSGSGNHILGLKHNIAATVAPGVNDDAGAGYSVGSCWVDVTHAKTYICVDSTTGAAVWNQTSPSSTYTADEVTLHLASTVFSIKSTYVGQTSITTLGTVTTGVWNGTAIANANLANSSLTVTAGTGLSGGGSVSLGGSTSLAIDFTRQNTWTGEQLVSITNAGTSSALEVASWTHKSSGTPVAGFGLALDFFLDDSTNVAVNSGSIISSWISPTHGSSKGRLALWALGFGTGFEGIRIDCGASAALLGFFGVVAVAQQTGDVGTGLVSLGLFSGTPTFAAANLTGTTLPSSIVTSSLTALGTVTTGVWNGTALTASFVPALNSITAPTGDVSLNSHKITSLLDPTVAQDAATKAYVDSVVQGITAKHVATCATAGTLPTYTYLSGVITFSATGVETVDGHTVALNDYVLVKDETLTNRPFNGLYLVTTAGAGGVAGIWTRSVDMDAGTEFPGAYVFVEQGSVNAATSWTCTNTTPPTVGTTNITFLQFSGAGTYTADEVSLHLSGTVFSLRNPVATNVTVSGSLTANSYFCTLFVTLNAATGASISSAASIFLETSSTPSAGSQMWSPATIYEGKGWHTGSGGAADVVDFALVNIPVQGTAAATAKFSLQYQINTGGFGEIFSVSSVGLVVVSSAGIDTAAALNLATTTATSIVMGNSAHTTLISFTVTSGGTIGGASDGQCIENVGGAATGFPIPNGINDFRLTGTSATPWTDSGAFSTIYMTSAYCGNRIAIYDGTRWRIVASAELSIAIGTVVAFQAYDLFVDWNSGTPQLTKLEWQNAAVTFTSATPTVVTWTSHGLSTQNSITFTTTGSIPTGVTANTQYFVTRIDANTFKISTTRANCDAGTFVATSSTGSNCTGHSPTSRQTALTTQDGVYVLTGTLTSRYLGSFCSISTTQTKDGLASRLLWNLYHRDLPRKMLASTQPTGYGYSTAALRQVNADVANQVDVMIGLVDSVIYVYCSGFYTSTVATTVPAINFGFDRTNVQGNDTSFIGAATATNGAPLQAVGVSLPGIGYHSYLWLEQGAGAGVQTWFNSGGAITGTIFN